MRYFFIISSIFSLFFSAISSANDVIQFCSIDKAFKPYFDNRRSLEQQTDLMLAKRVLTGIKANNWQHQLHTLPWLRCMKGLESGQYQAAFAMIKTQERARIFAFPADVKHYLAKVEYPIFYRKGGVLDHYTIKRLLFSATGAFDVAYYRSIQEFGLAAPLGYVAYHYLADKQLLADTTPDADVAFHALNADRLDGFVIEREIGQALLLEQGLDEVIVATEHAVLNAYWHVAFNKDFYQQNTAAVDNFWAHLNPEILTKN
ncbi:hypothetical protein HR060_01605 [Catenovulum sp. SM1970]|uniref:transporter substrate-binding domain-containing protein n=1 Tax=Marinifaba aquimaris TaxID=2741323 RepID=UPI001572F2B6|nr:transporter substrate-binding domain-containing protein [Marinifaba aquimaris]NTS75549.1 hypothetical protein [Marinifaba aquimaris]